jgi:RNA polymerase sigma factor (sigma-70 family)
LFDANKTMVYNLALSFLQNTEDAEDITQEVFIEVYNSFYKFNGNSTISTWIYRITVNKALDFIRKKKRKKRFSIVNRLFATEELDVESNQIVHFDHPGVLMEQKDNARLVFKLIDELKENQKTAFILFHLEDLSQKQIAEIMGISTKAVELLVRRAKLKLKEKLDKIECK